MNALAEGTLVRKIHSAYGRGGEVVHEVKDVMDDNRLGFVRYFTSGIQHQLSNYYMQMGIVMSELADTLNRRRSEEALDLLATMHNLFATMKRLTDLQSASRWDSKPEIQKLAPVVDSIKVLMSIMARRRSVNLMVHHDETNQAVLVDRFQFEQVIMNLYRNAEQAILSSGVRSGDICISTHSVLEADREQFSELKSRPYLCVTVKNSGPGINPDTFARIGELSFTTKPQGEGSGHGLQVCAYLMEEAGGFISAQTHPEHGTQFTLFFPVATGE